MRKSVNGSTADMHLTLFGAGLSEIGEQRSSLNRSQASRGVPTCAGVISAIRPFCNVMADGWIGIKHWIEKPAPFTNILIDQGNKPSV
jgi:hypothetical protein